MNGRLKSLIPSSGTAKRLPKRTNTTSSSVRAARFVKDTSIVPSTCGAVSCMAACNTYRGGAADGTEAAAGVEQQRMAYTHNACGRWPRVPRCRTRIAGDHDTEAAAVRRDCLTRHCPNLGQYPSLEVNA